MQKVDIVLVFYLFLKFKHNCVIIIRIIILLNMETGLREYIRHCPTMLTRDIVKKCSLWQDFAISIVGHVIHYYISLIITTIVYDTHSQLNHDRNTN